MANYLELLTRLKLRIGDDASDDNLYRQALNALECLLAQQNAHRATIQPPLEPTDHEAEGAMLYVMSRGR
jgi:hypothetical protein